MNQSDREADHQELTALRIAAQDAINTRNFEMLRPLLVRNLTVISVDGTKVQSLDEFQKYWTKLFTNKLTSLDRIEVNPVADGPTEFLSETVGICHGTSNDRYFFKSGKVRTMPERWTAVMIKEDGKWKISRFVFSANILDNPILGTLKQQLGRTAAVAGVGGLLAGALGFWLTRRR